MTGRGERTFEIVVGALGPADAVFEGNRFADQVPELPWDRREQVKLMVSATATLGEIVDKAADQFGVRIDFDGPLSLLVPTIRFASPDKEYAYLRLAENSQPGWSLRWQNVELGELIASSEAGFFDADPLKPLFLPLTLQGAIMDIGEMFLAMWFMWEHYLAARETIGLARTLLTRVRRALSVRERVEPSDWEAAFARVHELMAFLETPRTTGEVAHYMSLPPPSVADDALWGMGFAAGDDGRWHRGGDPASQVLWRGVLDLKRNQDSWDEEVPEKLEALLREFEGDSGGD